MKRPNRIITNQDLLGVRVGKWIVRIVFITVEFFLVHQMNSATASGKNPTTYWTLMIAIWIVFGAIERILRSR